MKEKKSYDKYVSSSDEKFVYDEKTAKTGSFIKQDCELYNDEDNIPGEPIRVKRITKPQEGWKVMKNGKDILVIKASRFSKQEKEYLRTVKGLSFIIDGVKQGWKSVSEFKRNLTI